MKTKVIRCNTCNVVLPGPYGTPGVAMSRTLSGVLLCSYCGTAEALHDASLIVGKQKISEWLSQCGSHEIYPLKALSEDFEKCTGLPFPPYIQKHTLKETQEQMRARGLGGTLQPTKERVVWGYVMAADFARHLVTFVSPASGRGRIFYDSIAAIEKGGL